MKIILQLCMMLNIILLKIDILNHFNAPKFIKIILFIAIILIFSINLNLDDISLFQKEFNL